MAKKWAQLVKRANDTDYIRNRQLTGKPGHDGYNALLGCDLEKLVRTRLKKQEKVRLLDIGAGEGAALSELEVALDDVRQRIEFVGIDLHAKGKVIKADALTYVPKAPFDIVTSVFCWTYIPEKLEAIERVHNVLLVPRGHARLYIQSNAVILNKPGEGNINRSEHSFEEFVQQQIPSAKYLFKDGSDTPRALVFTRAKKPITFPAKLTCASLPRDSAYIYSTYRVLS